MQQNILSLHTVYLFSFHAQIATIYSELSVDDTVFYVMKLFADYCGFINNTVVLRKGHKGHHDQQVHDRWFFLMLDVRKIFALFVLNSTLEFKGFSSVHNTR